jgi:hypothetical protein
MQNMSSNLEIRRFPRTFLGLTALVYGLSGGCDEDPSAVVDMQAPPGSMSHVDAGPTTAAPMDASTATAAADGATQALDTGQPSPDGRPVQDAASMPSCTPHSWKDPGTVPNPKLAAVAPDAGTTGKLWGKSKGLEAFDYLEEEFLFTGSSPAFTSRVVVHRHKAAAKFSGTVFVEWYNVTGGLDVAPLWAVSRDYFMREGHVHVGVSAQEVGATALKDYDAERYATIEHPGDSAANAIFAQAAMAIRSQSAALLGPCMPVATVIAVGQSQSASMLGAYIDAAHVKDRIYDGFMLHSSPFGAPITSDPSAPVFVISTMNEGDGALIDRPNVIEWEVAGASHNDAHLTGRGVEEQGKEIGITLECVNPLNDFPSFWVYNAALDGLNRWANAGEKPPVGAPFQTSSTGALQQDEYGNVLGGVRLPDIEVPIANYTATNDAANWLDFLSLLGCGLGGSVVPFPAQKLLQLYPTHDDYTRKYAQAADAALAAGYLLKADYDTAILKARSAPIPN